MSSADDKSSAAYIEWQKAHESQCSKNFHRSSPAMESEGALMLWRRSEQQLSLRYTTLISDGDAKTHSLLCHEDPYDEAAIEMHDCVCHVQMASDGVSTAEEGGCLLQEEEGANWLRRKGATYRGSH